MPWVRIDENALTHPKIIGLSHGAFRLWVAGLAHCQQHLTDGAIPDAALKTFPAVSQQRIHELTHAKLWQATDGGYQVHDYLEHNDSRAKVLKARAMGRDRKKRWEGKNASPNALLDALRTAHAPSGVVCSGDSTLSDGREGGVGETTLTARAGAFCEWYEDAHQRILGVGYMGTNNDYTKAQLLCEKFTDHELQQAAVVWFGMDDDFATNGTRTIPKFASRASHCVQLARKVTA